MTQPVKTWPDKDPDAVQDYRYEPPLDAGDTFSSITLTKVSGTVAIDSQADDATGVSAFISGGTDGEQAVFKAEWGTAGGRSDDAIILLGIVSGDYDALGLDYEKPKPQHLLMRYPAFSAVPISTVQYWLTDAERFVDESWPESDYAPAIMAAAAHGMAMEGLGTGNTSIPQGVTSFKSGTFSASLDASQASARGWASTRYGNDFLALLRRNFSGPVAIVGSAADCCVWDRRW